MGWSSRRRARCERLSELAGMRSIQILVLTLILALQPDYRSLERPASLCVLQSKLRVQYPPTLVV